MRRSQETSTKKRTFSVAFVFLLAGLMCLCLIPGGWCYLEWTGRRFWFLHGTSAPPDAIYFERSIADSMKYYHIIWAPYSGILAQEETLGWLYAVGPGHGFQKYRTGFDNTPYDFLRPNSLMANAYTSTYSEGFVKYHLCALGHGRVRWTADGRYFLDSTVMHGPPGQYGYPVVGTQIILLDGRYKCRKVKVLLAGEGWLLLDPDLSVRGLLAYARGPLNDFQSRQEVVVRDFRTGKHWVVGYGVNPTWSPNGEWLVYTGYDGLYLVRWDGKEKRKLLALSPKSLRNRVDVYYVETFPHQTHPETGMEWWWVPPRPDWSADGQWLIYHRWDERTGTFNIYKLNVHSGEEVLLIRNGLHPQWRWPKREVNYPEVLGLGH